MIDVELLKRPKVSKGSRTSNGSASVSYYGNTSETDYAARAANADEAAHALSAAGLDGNSSVWKTIRQWIDAISGNYLSKVDPDTANGLITFLKGLTSNELAIFIKGLQSYELSTFLKGLQSNELSWFLKGIAIGKDKKYGVTENGVATLAGILAQYVKSSDFSQGYLGGSGFGMYKDNGHSVIETDELVVRMKAYYASLEIRKLSYVGGDQVKSNAGSTLAKVVPLDTDGNELTDTSKTPNAYKCYFIDDDGTTRTENWWKVGDQARCQTFDIDAGVYKDVSNTYYWRLVIATGSEEVDIDGNKKHLGYVVLSNVATGFTLVDSSTGKNYQSNGTDIVFIGKDPSITNDEPRAEDKIVQLGSQNDPKRSYAVIDFITEQRTSYYYGISSYSLPEHEVMRLSPFGSWVYTNFFEMRVGSPTDWHPVTNYRGTWMDDIEYTYYNTVTSDGLLWMHNKRGYVSKGDKPSIFSDVWSCVSDGGNDLRIEFESSKGSVVYVSNVDLTLTAHLMFGQKVMDEYLFGDVRNQLAWSRESGVESEDRSWKPTMGDTANVLLLTHHKADANNRHDLGSQWETRLACSFTFKATIYSGDTNNNAKRDISGTLDFDFLS